MTVGNDCARCHTPANWLVDNITELHQENGFPLLGAHASISCTDCHTSATTLEFNRIGNDCINCHIDDFNATTNPNHQDAGFSTDCAACHRPDAFDWGGADNIDHSFFPLTAGHDISDCTQCHTSGDFSSTSPECVSCHLNDFENTLEPRHEPAGFSNDCTQCHTTDVGWMPANYADHDALHFPIYSGSHEGEWMKCTDCHDNNSDYSSFTCINCHINPETDEEHNGVGGYIYENTACLACHPTGDEDNSFDHNESGFPLTGAHITTDCIQCHSDGYAGTPTDCASCHTTEFNATANPDHNALGLSSDCAACHTTQTGWSPAAFDGHDSYYALNGAHAAIANDCAACHNGDYNNTPNTCAGCHINDYNQASDPDHQAAQFPTDCASCHSESTWAPSSFDHDAHYPLTGAHQAIEDDCVACHNGDYDNTPNTCNGCHAQDYSATVNPDHQALGLPTDCAECHSTQPDWVPASFDIHDQYYPLNGAHAAIANDCAACHNGDYSNTPNTCFGCHSEDYNNTTDPGHAAAQFPTDCTTCHSEDAWAPSTLEHDAQYFPIYSGAHEGEWNTCTECHTNPANYAEFSCIGCHTNPETDDEHQGVGGYVYENTACLACHPMGDADNVFDHNTTAFPLDGAHLAANCLDCHSSGYAGTPTDCASCHTTEFNATANPDHNALGLSSDCAACHTTQTGWSPAAFDGHDSYYALNGAHAAIANDCAACHNGDYNNTPNTCAGCHINDYNQASDPDHQAAQFPTDCASCHSESTWAPSSFDHDAHYPLTGAHQAIEDDCVACHNGDYDNTPNTCNGCHAQDYSATVNPDHQALGLPTDCAECHSTQPDWVPASFGIHDQYYPLNGAHAAIANDCAACHNGDYSNTPNTCFGCHSEDYNNTTDPGHAAAQFPTDCTTCHSEDAWAPSTLEHDAQYFPIYSGAHEGEWNTCTECHTNPANYVEFSCIGCHTNPETDDEHQGVGGYVYENTACLACHPMGDADNVFDHNTTAFPLDGAHLAANCLDCHSSGYAGTPTDCASCHTTEFNATANPDHNALGLSSDCAACHTTQTGWSPAAFDGHDSYYALNGAHAAIANDCAACHNGDYNNTPNTCAGCHINDYNQASDPDHQAAQFPTDCASCHSESTWAPSSFDHDAHYPLTGAHQAIEDDCVACHNGDYDNTPNTCNGCHAQDYSATVNPDHQALGLPTDCAECHSTQPDWVPASFGIHDQYYPLNGAHAAIANDCAACHNGDYSNTPNTCFGCHSEDYNNTTDPGHAAAQFPTDCTTCHSEDAWAPSTLEHDAQYFPIYSGAHEGEWNTCTECHTNPANYAEFSCIGCHTNPETDDEHQGVGGYVYENTACLACHPMGDADNVFDHNTTAFPLDGAHLAANCLDCHSSGYAGTPTDCASCHTTEFNATANPDHNALGLSSDCAACHTTQTGWSPAAFDGHDSYYALNGAHAAIANDCAACHNGDYNNTPNTCAGCHINDYNQASDPDHQAAQFPTDCASCHSESTWAPSSFDHDAHYPLTGAHQAIEDDCVACHNGDYDNTPNTCNGCHAQDYSATVNPDHQALGLPTDCAECHSTQPDWVPASFGIHDQYYPLNGAHAAIANDCAACHNGDYSNTPNTCFGCHSEDYNNTENPDHIVAQFATDCLECHTENDWTASSFDHDGPYFPIYSGAHEGEWNTCMECHTNPSSFAEFSCLGCHTNPETDDHHQGVGGYVYENTACLACHPTGDAANVFDHNATAFPLTGAHLSTTCVECHTNGYAGTPTDCNACHLQDYASTANPDHTALGFPMDCASCHTTAPDWAPASFDIHDQYYPLTGAHAAIANNCVDCHNGDFNNTPNTCFGCHSDDYNATSSPSHAAASFPTDCQQCHTENAWVPSSFDHDQYYPLSGAHAAIASNCNDCHNGDYNNTPNTCDGCHIDDYNAATVPNHVNAQLPLDCESCHALTAWVPATFDHDQYFPMTGAHLPIENDCFACHQGNYNNTPNTCDACHADDYNQSNNPNHLALGFPMDCASCHTTAPDWAPASFDIHDQYYPLTGAHAAIANNCVDCHNGDFNNTPNTCFGCHSDDYNATSSPSHAAASFPTDCQQCHTENAWVPSSFDHDQYYPLSGAHAAIASNCNDCHNGDYNNTPNTCDGCHIDDYNAATVPNHVNAQLPLDCESCHALTAWVPATFDHDQYFPMTGAHLLIENDCFACHQGNYNNTPNTCDACHADDYNQSNNPNHLALGFPMDCASCHTTAPDWAPASFDIHDQYYPLTGAHAAIANNCVDCHNGDFNNTPNTCFGCHSDDYNATSSPSHAAASFPTDCQQCHTENAWVPSSFDHDQYYPLSGAHAAIASNCNDCHNGDYNNTPNTCFGCHSDDYNAVTSPNHVAANFSTDCQQCHTEGAWIPSSFDHDQYYPLVGAHAAIAFNCNDCHNGDYNNTPNTCFGCHSDDYNAVTSPNHVAANFSTDCQQCHTEGAWIPSSFDHDQYYPLVGAHAAIAFNCNDCHNGDYNNTPNTCFGCHSDDYNATNNPNHAIANFPTDCEACHGQNTWIPSTFDHDAMYFPIYSGKHDEEWNSCTDCHTTPGNYAIFDCINCHNNAADLADEHDEVPGYVFENNACFACHPTGED